MQTFFLFALIIASVGLMVIAISKWKIHPFIVMTVIALLVGLIWGAVYPESELTPAKVVNSVKSGFGDIMTSIGIVILCGTIIGTILEKTGAADHGKRHPETGRQEKERGRHGRHGLCDRYSRIL